MGDKIYLFLFLSSSSEKISIISLFIKNYWVFFGKKIKIIIFFLRFIIFEDWKKNQNRPLLSSSPPSSTSKDGSPQIIEN
jgi:hypothetical protein